MKLTPEELTQELAASIDADLAKAIVKSYVEMQQRFVAGDWKPSELDGGRLCEAIARALYQLDSGTVTHSQLPAEICEKLEDLKQQHTHNLQMTDRRHMAKAIELVYKFRSARGPVHISPRYSANQMDAMMVLHVGKWILAEFLRLAWKQDQEVVADTIAQIIQLEHSIIHELDGKPLVLVRGIQAGEEILLLLNHAMGNRLSRSDIHEQATNQKTATLNAAMNRLVELKETRVVADDEIALTPLGQKRVIEEIIPKYAPR